MRTSLQVRINRARLEHVARRHMQANARRAGARALASSPRTVGNLAFIVKWLTICQTFDDMTMMARCRRYRKAEMKWYNYGVRSAAKSRAEMSNLYIDVLEWCYRRTTGCL